VTRFEGILAWVKRFAEEAWSLLWPSRSGKYRDRSCFRLRDPEEERPEDLPVTRLEGAPAEASLCRRTVRATQPPSRRSLNGGRRK
jgi:hypothetical protein